MVNLPTTDPGEIYELHKRLVERLKEDPEVVTAFSGEHRTIEIQLKDPDIVLHLVLDGSDTRLTRKEEGDDQEADVTIGMSWQTAHRFWCGNLNMMSLLLSGDLSVQGADLDPLFRLKSVVPKACRTYNQIVDEFSGSGN